MIFPDIKSIGIGIVTALLLAVSITCIVYHSKYKNEVALVKEKNVEIALQVSNVNNLQSKINEINKQIENNNTIANIATNNANKIVLDNNSISKDLDSKINTFVKAPIAGNTACDKVQTVDKEFLQELRNE